MKLHLPVLLRKALLACFSFAFAYSMSSGSAAAASLTLGSEDSLTIDSADAESIPDLENGTLQLSGDTILLLSNCGSGDGKTYTLLTDVSGLLDAAGNPLPLTEENNAASLYFDALQPGTGFWANGWLQLAADGSVQLVLHDTEVQEALTITARQTASLTYNYYAGICFRDITYTLSGTSSARGGAIYGDSHSTVTLSNNGSVEFSGNSASFFSTSSTSACGGAIYGDSHSTVTLSNNGSVEFSGNEASSSSYRGAYGGAIYGGSNSTITLSNNGSVVFEGNKASSCDQISGGTITLSNNGIVVLELLYDIAHGGAICGDTIMLSNNGSVVFEGNKASSHDYTSGGAICGDTIMLSNNGSVVFEGNKASSHDYTSGGAICGSSYITLNENGSVTFSGNAASSGGAIYGGTILLNNNSSVEFCDNSSGCRVFDSRRGKGGAIYGDMISICSNGNLRFCRNSVIWDGALMDVILPREPIAESPAYGGAIYGRNVTLRGNGCMLFSGNAAHGDAGGSGGAIYSEGELIIENNALGTTQDGKQEQIIFEDNDAIFHMGTVSYGGGAIFANGTLKINNNGEIIFRNNESSLEGSAIYVSGDVFFMQNNKSVLFENKGSFSAVFSRATEVNFSAPADGYIEFLNDGFKSASTAVALNNWYVTESGEKKPQIGDIIFSGSSAYYDSDGVAALYDGRLIVRDGARMDVKGIDIFRSVSGDSISTLMLDSGWVRRFRQNDMCEISIAGGSAMEIRGCSRLSRSAVIFHDGSKFIFNIAAMNAATAALTLESSSLTQSGALTLVLKGENGLVHGQSYKLLTGLTRPETWTAVNITVESGTAGWDVGYDDLSWDGDTLWIYYDGAIQELPPPAPEPEFTPDLNRNQQIVYDTIKDIMGEGNPGGLLGELGKEVTGTRDEAKLKQLLDELGGAEYATLLGGQQAAARGHMGRLRGKMGSGHLLAGEKTRAYIEAYHHRSELDGDADGRGYELNESGGQFALEFLGQDGVSGGISVAAGRSKLQPEGGMTQKSDNTYVDAFMMHRDGAYTAKFSLGVGVHKYDLDRRVAGNAVSADAGGSSVNFMHESSWALQLDEVNSVQFFGAVESTFSKLGAFTEDGADTASLQVEGQDAWVTTLSVGARYLYSFAAVDAAPAATLSLQAGVEFDLGDTDGEVEMCFEGASRHSFRQSSAGRDTFGYNLGASLNLPVSDRAAVYAGGDAVLRGDSYEVNANAGLQMAF